MKILKNVFELNKAIKNYKNVGFVPTMGGIHRGHVSLIKISQKNNKETIVSIFVNPTQFNQKKDFKNYRIFFLSNYGPFQYPFCSY